VAPRVAGVNRFHLSSLIPMTQMEARYIRTGVDKSKVFREHLIALLILRNRPQGVIVKVVVYHQTPDFGTKVWSFLYLSMQLGGVGSILRRHTRHCISTGYTEKGSITVGMPL